MEEQPVRRRPSPRPSPHPRSETSPAAVAESPPVADPSPVAVAEPPPVAVAEAAVPAPTPHAARHARPSPVTARPKVSGPIPKVRLAAVVGGLAIVLGTCGYLAVHDTSSGSGSKLPASEKAALNAVRVAIPHIESYSYKSFDADVSAALPYATSGFQTFFSYAADSVARPHALSTKETVQVSYSSATLLTSTADTYVFLVVVHKHVTSATASDINETDRLRVTMQDVNGSWLVSSLVPQG